MCPPDPPGTHSVVSWLMLVKEELLKELILLLLKSLERSRTSVFVKKEALLLVPPSLSSPPYSTLPRQAGQGSLSGEDAGTHWICS